MTLSLYVTAPPLPYRLSIPTILVIVPVLFGYSLSCGFRVTLSPFLAFHDLVWDPPSVEVPYRDYVCLNL